MSRISRRRFLQIGAGLTFYPLLSNSATPPRALTEISANQFLYGGLKGFVIGSERNNRDLAYFNSLVSTGANVGRIFFHFTKCNKCVGYQLAPNDVVALKHVLDIARTKGVRLIVVGDFQDSGQSSFWQNESLRKSFVDNWREFVKVFGNDPVIAGLDLLNEPNPPWPSNDVVDTHETWRSLAQQAIDVIRKERITLPIIYEGVGGGQSIGLKGLVPLNDSNIVYSIHYYTPHEITHQKVNASWIRTIPYPASIGMGLGKWDAERGATFWNIRQMEFDLRHVIDFQLRYKLPIYVGEFSCVRWAPNGSQQRYISDCIELFRKYGWSWTYHEYRGWPGWDAEIASEDPQATRRSLNAPVIKLLRAEMSKNSK
ncbi:MAG TPA: cellulase family glycosylhydrolase [Methylotenera sp.]|nr:cellulase family glycosylhydrolase [Methylotenera sp.]HPH06646.1 cellulase family glycosylhydrolase [Methylotenera sp.]HPM49017.1 cellulase family glycosylhydrolase [Methylotenera sp.]